MVESDRITQLYIALFVVESFADTVDEECGKTKRNRKKDCIHLRYAYVNTIF